MKISDLAKINGHVHTISDGPIHVRIFRNNTNFGVLFTASVGKMYGAAQDIFGPSLGEGDLTKASTLLVRAGEWIRRQVRKP